MFLFQIMVLLLPLQVCLKRLIYFSWPRKQLRRTEALKLSCFCLQILSLLKRLAESRYGGNRDFSMTREPILISKRENPLCYINQGYIFTVKGGELAIYNHIFLLGQLTVVANQPKDIETYECKKNEVKLIVCMYDQATGELLGLQKQLA